MRTRRKQSDKSENTTPPGIAFAKPSETTYRVALRPADYRKVREFVKSMGQNIEQLGPLGFPTIIAERNGNIVGVLGSAIRKNIMWAGPLAISGGPRPFVFLKLVEYFEAILANSRIPGYAFWIPVGEEKYIKLLARAGLTPYTIKDGLAFYEKRLG